MIEVTWNENVESARTEITPGTLWVNTETETVQRFPSNATPSGTQWIRLALVSEYRDRMEAAIASSETLQQWLKGCDTLLVVIRIGDNHQMIDYSFHANIKMGRFLLHPLSNP